MVQFSVQLPIMLSDLVRNHRVPPGKSQLGSKFHQVLGWFHMWGGATPQKTWMKLDLEKSHDWKIPSSKLRKRWKKMLRVIHRLYLMVSHYMSSYQRVMVFLIANLPETDRGHFILKTLGSLWRAPMGYP